MEEGTAREVETMNCLICGKPMQEAEDTIIFCDGTKFLRCNECEIIIYHAEKFRECPKAKRCAESAACGHAGLHAVKPECKDMPCQKVV